MLDIKFIHENEEKVKKAILNKGVDLNLDELLIIDEKRVNALVEIEKLNAEKNKLNIEIKSEKADKKKIIKRGKEIKEKISKLEPLYKEIKEKFDDLMARVPQVPSDDTPIGLGDEDNVEIYRSPNIPEFDFQPKNHIELGQDLNILDLEKGAKVCGYRGYYVKNEGVSLMMAFMLYAINKLIEKGFSPMIPPTLVKGFALFGSGHFKGVEYDPEVDEIYEMANKGKEVDGSYCKERKFLVGTAEPSILAYFANDVLKEEELPLKVCGYSQCYRSEIGSYGKDTRGIYRVHEFMKVEQVIFSKADISESDKLQQEMVAVSKEMHEELGLPYRQIQVCTGDMGAGKYKMFDIEAWMPGLNRFGETGSASNLLDWQARRLNVKYVDKNGEKKFVYMLNNTALASPRTFIAILENYQQADGSVKVPEVLKKYMPAGMDVIKKK